MSLETNDDYIAKLLAVAREKVSIEMRRQLGSATFRLDAGRFPADGLMSEARKFAQKIMSKGAVALELAKRVIEEGYETDLTSALALEAQAFALCFGTEAKTAGIHALLEQRLPHFKGR